MQLSIFAGLTKLATNPSAARYAECTVIDALLSLFFVIFLVIPALLVAEGLLKWFVLSVGYVVKVVNMKKENENAQAADPTAAPIPPPPGTFEACFIR